MNDIKKRVNNLLKNNPQNELQKLKKQLKETEINKKKIIKEFKISKNIQRMIEMLSNNAFFRLYRRYIICQIFYYGQNLFKEMQKRLNLDTLNDLMFCFYDEIKDGLLKGRELNKKLIKERQKAKFVLYGESDKMNYYSGKEAIKFLNSQNFEKIETKGVKVLNGTAACIGKVKGMVKIILELSDMKKVQKGDILVAIETTPDLLPAMEKAAAFITDEGGLSCHAAVVSREMNKPCIVGTKVGTKVLKDGDLVEVDANKGIVKKMRT